MTTAPVPLTALSLPVESFAPGDDLVELLPRFSPSGVWLREGRGMIGLGSAARTSSRGADRFAQLAHWYDAVRSASPVHTRSAGLETTPGAGLTAFITVSYAADSAADSELIIPEIVLGRSDRAQWVTLIQHAGTATQPPGPADLLEALGRYGLEAEAPVPAAEAGGSPAGGADGIAPLRLCPAAGGEEPAGPPAQDLPRTWLRAGTHPEEHYLRAVETGTAAIHERRVEKIVLARDALVTAETPLAAGAVLRELARKYQNCWTYFAGSVLGATPEMLVQVRGDQLRARVLAGTIDGDTPFDQARTALLDDAKQRSEHQIAVESLLSHLGPVTASLSAQDRPEVLVLPNVYHLATDVTGQLSSAEGVEADAGAERLSPLLVAERAHPTAAICGTPTATAQHMIAALEELDRGPFSGPVGWIDGAGNADFGIALRGGVLEEGSAAIRLYAGCGVVAGSEPEAELAETWAKMRPMLSALGLDH